MRVISGSARGTKLESIDSMDTRPTLDRVKESLFNIIQNEITEESTVLDLFAGSGAIGIEFLSRGAQKAVFVDNSRNATQMIEKNLNKTHLIEKAEIFNKDYIRVLKDLNQRFDFVFLDPPYKQNITIEALKVIEEKDLIKNGGIVIIETDELERDKKEIENNIKKYKIYDIRKYGRATLIFLR